MLTCYLFFCTIKKICAKGGIRMKRWLAVVLCVVVVQVFQTAGDQIARRIDHKG